MSGDHGRGRAVARWPSPAQRSRRSSQGGERGDRRRATCDARAAAGARASSPPSCRSTRGCCWSPTSFARGRREAAGLLGGAARRRPRFPVAAGHGWDAADRRDAATARRAARPVPANSLLGPVRRRADGADPAQVSAEPPKPSLSPAARSARPGRANRLRLALADGFLAAGDRARARRWSTAWGPSRGAAQAADAAPAACAIDSLPPSLFRAAGRRRRSICAGVKRAAPPVDGPGRALRQPRRTAWRCCCSRSLLDDAGRIDEALPLLPRSPATTRCSPMRATQARILSDESGSRKRCGGAGRDRVRQRRGAAILRGLATSIRRWSGYNEAATPMGGRSPWPEPAPDESGRCCCCAPRRSRRPTAGPRRKQALERRCSSRPSSR